MTLLRDWASLSLKSTLTPIFSASSSVEEVFGLEESLTVYYTIFFWGKVYKNIGGGRSEGVSKEITENSSFFFSRIICLA